MNKNTNLQSLYHLLEQFVNSIISFLQFSFLMRTQPLCVAGTQGMLRDRGYWPWVCSLYTGSIHMCLKSLNSTMSHDLHFMVDSFIDWYFYWLIWAYSLISLQFTGHNGAVRYIGHSPTGPAFITCSEDFRARFWYRKADTD